MQTDLRMNDSFVFHNLSPALLQSIAVDITLPQPLNQFAGHGGAFQ